MPFQVSYMGTKRQLAPMVSDLVDKGPSGSLLDLFSGICTVGSAVGSKRQIWCNDVQLFSSTVASALFGSQDLPPSSIDAADLVFPYYTKNKNALSKRFNKELGVEKDIFHKEKISEIDKLKNTIKFIYSSDELEKERKRLVRKKNTFPYRLFSITYAAGYFGLYQCVQIDSLKYAIDFLYSNKIVSLDGHRWMMLALCQAISKVSTTTGHFAQYMKINKNNRRYYISQRNKSVWREWINALDNLAPIGSKSWRKTNKVFRDDALKLLNRLSINVKSAPSIIYADPPYTGDQYSRYYHLYETLLLYDYPTALGEGRYRPDRFQSSFSLKSKVSEAFDNLIRGCAALGSQLVLSYPQSGLIENSSEAIMSKLNKCFSKVESYNIVHYHSSLGASKGLEKQSVVEILYWAR